jgi:hypothetical protein
MIIDAILENSSIHLHNAKYPNPNAVIAYTPNRIDRSGHRSGRSENSVLIFSGSFNAPLRSNLPLGE